MFLWFFFSFFVFLPCLLARYHLHSLPIYNRLLERVLYVHSVQFRFSCFPLSLVPILSADLLPCSRRKAVFRAVSSGFQAQWESPSCSDPMRPSWRWWLTHSQLRPPELLLLIHTRQTLGWLGNMNLHSQREAFSSQLSSNLDMGLIFPQGTPGWARLESETSLDGGNVFPLWCSK